MEATRSRKTFRDRLRAAGAGRLAVKLFYRPTAQLRWVLSFGYGNALRYVSGEAAMRRAARQLPSLDLTGSDPFEATYMTGRRHWHQTAFAAWSLAKVLPQGLKPTFQDDGTLSADQIFQLRRLFPQSRIISRTEALETLERSLPTAQFPLLRRAERNSTFVRKLVSPRAGSQRWQLYLDSDMLFFRRPVALEEAARVKRSVYLVDHIFAYCLPQEQIDALTGYPVRPRVNGGLIGLDDAGIDWPRVEHWLRQMPADALDHSMLEQTLAAMLVSRDDPVAVEPPDYQILFLPQPPPTEATLLHYIYHSKVLFVAKEWRRVRALHSA